MKKLFLIVSLLVSLVGYSQYPPNGTKNQWKQGIALGSKNRGDFNSNDSLILTIDKNGKLLWRGNGANATWFTALDSTSAGSGTVTSIATNNGTGINGGTITGAGTLSIDTTNISTRLFRIKGTDSLAGLIALKLSIADTANMLSTYQRLLANYSTTYALSNDVKDSIQARLRISDTAAMLTPFVQYSDTANMLNKYVLNNRFVDTTAALQSRIQTKQPLGAYITFADSTTILAGRWLPNRSADSISVIRALANSKLSISDTAAMLSGYNLQRVTNLGSTTTQNITANSFLLPSSGNAITTDGSSMYIKAGNGNIYIGRDNVVKAEPDGKLSALSFIKSGGTSSQYLMADGSVSTLTNPVTGTGVSGRVTYWNGTGSVTSLSTFTFDGSTVGVPNLSANTNIQAGGLLTTLNETGTGNRIAYLTSGGTIKRGTIDPADIVSSSAISGTTNYIPKFTSAPVLANSQLFDNGTNVGIGTTSPNRKFEVSVTNANGSSIPLRITNSAAPSSTNQQGVKMEFANDNRYTTSSTSSAIESLTTNYINGAADLLFLTNNGTSLTEIMRLTSGGNVVAGSFVKSGGTSSQFLKADGSVDGNTYATTSALSGYLPLTGGTLTGTLSGTNISMSGSGVFGTQTTIIGSGAGYYQAATILRSATTSNPELRALGTYMFNEGTDKTWFTGNPYNGADAYIIGRINGTTFNDQAADPSVSSIYLNISSTGAATFSSSVKATSLISSGSSFSFYDSNGSTLRAYMTTSGFGIKGSFSIDVFTVATLPAGSQGALAMITDGSSYVQRGSVSGGGSVVSVVYHDGGSWRYL